MTAEKDQVGKVLSRDAILAVKDLKEPQRVEVPEWGGAIFVKEMTGHEREQFETFAASKVKDGKMDLSGLRISLLLVMLVDCNGLRIFGPEDASKLNSKSGTVLAKLGGIAQELNGLGATAPEELRKNS